MYQYDYSKLRGKIRECFQTQSDFAQKVGISETSLSYKLNNKTLFDQDEIMTIIGILNLEAKDVIEIFFTEQVDKISTK